MRIALADVQRNISDIANREEYTPDIIYELLAAYGRSQSAISQLRSGHLNKAESKETVLQKDVVYFRVFPKGTSLELEVQELSEDPLTVRYKPRYIIATDLINLAAKDIIKSTTLTIKLADIDNDLDFFYAWTGDEVVDTKTEAVADRRAADKMNELYVEIENENLRNFKVNSNFRHELNVFFTRLLFCFFAEDTGIFLDKQFTNAVKTFTQLDGSDLSWFFEELFRSLDTTSKDKPSLKSPFKDFPYVNGTIFNTSKHSIAIPTFSAQARHLILECGRQNWAEINPDIFGTMFQGVVDPARREESGMDYTSVPNIMKVIQPLFLDELHEQFDKHFDNEKKLWLLLNRITGIKIFDPACGSGNFLIIAYKELRQLQHAIIGRINEIKPAGLSGNIPSSNLLEVDHLYGIEIDDFARELAILSIFLAKHQMNMEFNKQFGTSLAIIPLIELKTIAKGNATKLDWQEVCPNTGRILTTAEQGKLFGSEEEQLDLSQGNTYFEEIYLIGNPPYRGSSLQSTQQKKDFKEYFNEEEYSGNLDYISIWVVKGARYIAGTKAQLAFVSTNSICQGEHVGALFPKIYKENLEIGFAHTSFKWQNSARDNSGVAVIVLSLRNIIDKPKYLYSNNVRSVVKNINPYLYDGRNIIVYKKSKSISDLPTMSYGNKPVDGGFLILNDDEKKNLLDDYPQATEFIKRFVGAREYINNIKRWCLWINDNDLDKALAIPPISKRIDQVRQIRLASKDIGAVALANKSHQFRDFFQSNSDSIIVPQTTSERREYIPMGLLGKEYIISNAARVIYNAELWLFALLSSKTHNLWVRTVSGKLKTDTQYSNTLSYNTFPIRDLTDADKEILNRSGRKILLTRASHPEKTLADLYDPDNMPGDLREVHEENNHLIDNLYKKGGFKNDEERLVNLFDLYEKMTIKENTK